MRNYYLPLAATALFIFNTHCAPAKKAERPVPPETIELKVTDDFLNTPDNVLVFNSITKGIPQVRYVTFKAPTHGILYLSKSSYGLVTGCQGTNAKDAYHFEYSYKLKNKTTGAYSEEIQPKETSNRDLMALLELNQNDELQVRVELQSEFTCQNAKLYLTAIFK